jgi:hypothetical protein
VFPAFLPPIRKSLSIGVFTYLVLAPFIAPL